MAQLFQLFESQILARRFYTVSQFNVSDTSQQRRIRSNFGRERQPSRFYDCNRKMPWVRLTLEYTIGNLSGEA